MAAQENRDVTEGDADIAAIVSQILNDVIDFPSDQPQPSTSDNYPYYQSSNEASSRMFPQPTTTPTILQQEGDSANVTSTPLKNSDVEDKKSGEAEEIQSNLPYKTCTVKEMLSEILDCTIIRKPSLLLPSTSAGSDRSVPSSSSPPPEYLLDPRTVPRQIYNVRSNDSVASRVQCTVKEVIGELMDHMVVKKLERQAMAYDYSRPGTSRTRSEHLDVRENVRAYEIYRACGAGIVNSTNAIHDEFYLQKSSGLSIQRILPSYSSVLKMGPPKGTETVCSTCSFVPRKPPPSYAEVEGIWEDSPSLISSESAVFGPDPTYMICPRCRTAVITDVQVHRSFMTHLLALFLCLCLCWPCCLMPYCLRACSYSHHSCPHCSHYFGMYRPF